MPDCVSFHCVIDLCASCVSLSYVLCTCMHDCTLTVVCFLHCSVVACIYVLLLYIHGLNALEFIDS